jgi:hypothetical protein
MEVIDYLYLQLHPLIIGQSPKAEIIQANFVDIFYGLIVKAIFDS